jgi:hypothetical protein
MAKKAPAARPSLAEDEAALIGSWIHDEENRLLHFKRGEHGFWAYVLSGDGYASLDLGLEDLGDRRVLVEEAYDTDGDRKNPLYEYRLRDDRLELERLPGRQPCSRRARSSRF